MADEGSAPARNRRFGSKGVGRKWLLFVGDCSQVGNTLARKPITPGWVALGFVDSLLRTYGQVVFCNNPLTGFVLLATLLVVSPFPALAGVATTSVAIVAAWLADQPEDLVRAGIMSFNSLLVGHVTMALLPGVKGGDITGIDWVLMMVAAVLGMYLTSAYFTLFGHISKHPMPGFTVPFVTAQALVFLCGSSPALRPAPAAAALARVARDVSLNATDAAFFANALNATGSTDVVDAALNATAATIVTVAPTILLGAPLNTTGLTGLGPAGLDWGKVFYGVIVSMTQVFAQEHFPAALVMYLGVILSSPITALMCLVGSTVTTLIGALLAASPAGVYEGHWGFNGLLTAASMGGFTLVLTPQSVALTLVASTFCGAIQAAIMPTFTRIGVPIMSIPFNLAALIMLCATSRGDSALVRPSALTYPEKHRRDWRRERKARKSEKLRSISETLPENGTDGDQTRKLEAV